MEVKKDMKIGVNEISVNSTVSIREENDEETIERYMDVLEDFPPIVVFRTDDEYLLADGFHRWTAAVRRGWKEIDAEVREGSYEEAYEYAVSANLKHGKPLTSEEYETALLRLRKLHPNWTQRELATFLNRSQKWVSYTFAALSVEEICAAHNLDRQTRVEISKAPKELWSDIGSAAKKEEWTVEETREKIKRIKAEPERAYEIIQPRIEVPEAPSDKLIPLTKEIKKLCEMEEGFCEKLDPSLYNWGSGALAVHVLHGLYVLAEKTSQRAEKMKRMIEFLEGRGR